MIFYVNKNSMKGWKQDGSECTSWYLSVYMLPIYLLCKWKVFENSLQRDLDIQSLYLRK